MKCSKCGKEIANDSAFCEHCGEPIKQNRKYGIRRTDMRWILLVAMAIASFAMLASFEAKSIYLHDDWTWSLCAFVPSLVLLILALVYGTKKLLPWSFVIIMAVLAFMNGAMYISAVDNRQSHADISIEMFHPLDEEGEEASAVLVEESLLSLHRSDWLWGYDGQIPEEEYAKLETYAEDLAADLRKKGTEVSLNREVERYYYPGWGYFPYLMAELVVLFIYLIYAFIAYKKKWTF